MKTYGNGYIKVPDNEELGEVKSSIYVVFGNIFVPILYYLETEIYRVMQGCQKKAAYRNN